MNPEPGRADKEGFALLFAPIPGDAVALRAMLRGLRLGVVACASPQEFYDRLADDALLAVLTEEALVQCQAEQLKAVLERQPPWSDIPLLALAGREAARVDQGAGLGLSLAAGFVRKHDGHIELESEPGQGTRVTLRFPRQAA